MAATCIAVFLIPVTYYVVERLRGEESKPPPDQATPGENKP